MYVCVSSRLFLIGFCYGVTIVWFVVYCTVAGRQKSFFSVLSTKEREMAPINFISLTLYLLLIFLHVFPFKIIRQEHPTWLI